MPSLAERSFAACCRLSAAIVALVPLGVVAALGWAAIASGARSAVLDRSLTHGYWLTVAGSTLALCLAAALVGGGLGIGAAFAAEELAPGPVRRSIEAAIALFAAVPAVAFGWYAAIVMTPEVARRPFGAVTPFAAVALILSVMIAPTSCALVTRALRRVPDSVRRAAAAAGANRLQTTVLVVAPAFRRYIAAALLASFARCVGEATAMQIAMTSLGVPIATAAAEIFARVSIAGFAATGPAYYVAALVLTAIGFACAIVVAREYRGLQWA